MKIIHAFSIICIFLVPAAALAAVIHVPGDQPTIQAGINAAADGDTVMVADGTYTGTGNRDLDLHGLAVTVRSENGASWCTVDCGAIASEHHRGFFLHSGEEANSVIRGFTIRNGYSSDYGGGIYCSGASPTIAENTITGNTAVEFGGGIGCAGASSPKIINNNISGNVVLSEEFPHGGGGIYCYSSTAFIGYNLITGNSAAFFGGGICCDMSNITIASNVISDNTADGGGSGICCYNLSFPAITNNIISGNTGENRWGGGGIYCLVHSFPLITNNTIVDNICSDYYAGGGGICCEYLSAATIKNTILWGNLAFAGQAIYIGTDTYPSYVTISHSDVEGGLSSVYIETLCSIDWQNGMVNDIPMFATGALGDYYLSQISAGQAADSPCLDAGDVYIGRVPEGKKIPAGTTATDHALDSHKVDMGFHYAIIGVAVAGGPYQGRAGEAITFDAGLSFDPYGNISGYRWDWTNDGIWDTDWLADPVTTHTYSAAFDGQAKLQVKDSDDFLDADTADVHVLSAVNVPRWLELMPDAEISIFPGIF